MANRAKNVPAKVFIPAWQGAATIDDFCAATGMNKKSASVAATGLRKHGVPLKEFERGGRARKNDYGELAELARSCTASLNSTNINPPESADSELEGATA